MPCPTCHGFGQWWEWWVGKTKHRSFCKARPIDTPATAIHHICPECIGGTASCCDAAGSAQPESARTQ